MNTLLCLLRKCGAALLFGITYLFQELLLVALEVGKWLVTCGNQLSDELEKVLLRMKGILVKECPPFDRADKLPFWILLLLFIFGWLTSRSMYHPTSGPLDLGWLAWLFVLLATVLALIAIVYALRHILLWIAGILAILGLISVLASAPSCSAPSVSNVTPEKTTEYCWFYEECFWKSTSVHWPKFSFPSYCWFWEECYPHDNQESSGSSALASNKVDHQGAIYCWFWESCFWHKDHSVVLKPTVVKPVKTEEAKVSQPETTEYIIQNGDTLWKLSGGDPVKVDAIAHLNAGILDPYWLKNCSVIHTKTGKWCNAPKHTLQIGMGIFIPIAK